MSKFSKVNNFELMSTLYSDIKWNSGQPDGGSKQSFVGIRVLKKSFNDLNWEYSACVSCKMDKSTAFILRGVCKNSFLDTEYFPTLCGGYIGFIGNMISIW